MPGPLEGVRVVELGFWVAGPSAGAVMADWGTEDVIADPQAHAAGVFVEVPAAGGGTVPGIASPVDFSVTPWAPAGPSPECGQHTEEVLLELGYDWAQIAALKDAGAIP